MLPKEEDFPGTSFLSSKLMLITTILSEYKRLIWWSCLSWSHSLEISAMIFFGDTEFLSSNISWLIADSKRTCLACSFDIINLEVIKFRRTFSAKASFSYFLKKRSLLGHWLWRNEYFESGKYDCSLTTAASIAFLFRRIFCGWPWIKIPISGWGFSVIES